jgi:hypothetical protein
LVQDLFARERYDLALEPHFPQGAVISPLYANVFLHYVGATYLGCLLIDDEAFFAVK